MLGHWSKTFTWRRIPGNIVRKVILYNLYQFEWIWGPTKYHWTCNHQPQEKVCSFTYPCKRCGWSYDCWISMKPLCRARIDPSLISSMTDWDRRYPRRNYSSRWNSTFNFDFVPQYEIQVRTKNCRWNETYRTYLKEWPQLEV